MEGFGRGIGVSVIKVVKDVLVMIDDSPGDGRVEIIGISTDKKKYELNWKEAIAKYNLSWLQYWDIDGKNASNYSINAFPANFLLNTQGEITYF